MDSLRKRRNLTEDTAETVQNIKSQIDAFTAQQAQIQEQVKEWQDKVSSQIENLMIAFHEKKKSRGAGKGSSSAGVSNSNSNPATHSSPGTPAMKKSLKSTRNFALQMTDEG